ncbi:MAG: Hsp20/alpha crystallin family protein [Syntrophobacteria bacterium]
MFELMPRRTRRGLLARPRRDVWDWFFEGFEPPEKWPTEREWVPSFDVSETDSEIIVKVELPGMDVKDIDITLTDGVLTIQGEKKREDEDKKENYHRIERTSGSFCRRISLPVELKNEAIDATYKDGVLTVSLPKAEEQKPRKIDVKS